MRRVNLLHAHGSPTRYWSSKGCRCVACRAARAEYRAEHRDENAAYDAAYRSKHREEIAAYRATHYAEHREESAAYAAAHYASHRDERRASGAAYYASHREETADRKRQREYNLLPGEWAAMLAAQGNSCAICGTTEPGGKYGKWHTDHDHATGLTRGLLCQHCNTGLGQFRDNPEYLTAAIEYLVGATP